MRAAAYARFSTDLQREASIADQLVVCRRHAERLGAVIVAEYSDAAISGSASLNRPGLQQLLADASAGRFDLVISEHTDRLSRSGGGTWDVYEDLKALGISIDTAAQGRITAMHAGMAGTMSAMQLEEGARKTRRGLAGVAREGRHAGGRVYGYTRVRELDERGELKRGVLAIDELEAEVVREIFTAYAGGSSPRAIAGRLNERGVPGPRSAAWNASTINGNAARGNGVLHNELYQGILVWGRHAWIKDRRTGARRARAGDAAEIVRTSAEHLRIVPAELWQAVQDRYAGVKRLHATGRAMRPKHLLSGLVRCGVCGGAMTREGRDSRFVCSVHKEKGSALCGNGRQAMGAEIQARVLAAIRENLLHPAVIEAAVREFHQAANARSADSRRRVVTLEQELGEVKRRAERLVDQVADGILPGIAVRERLIKLEARREEIEAELQQLASQNQVVAFHANAAGFYRDMVEALQSGLESEAEAERENARQAFRKVVRAVVVTPLPERGKYQLSLEGDLAHLLQIKPEEGVREVLGAGTGFEPVTFRL